MHMVSDNHAKRAAEEAEANKRRVKAITEALDGANFLRANLATSELKKAQIELMRQPLPGME